MRREGYGTPTIRAAVKTLKAVGRRCNILNPESFKDYLSKATYSENRRDKILGDLTRFYKWLGIDFYRPLSRRVETLPFIPLESEIDSLIGGLGPKLSAFTRLVKETGARPMEIFQLRWTDLDTTSSTVSITPEKGSRPRRPRITATTLASVLSQPRIGMYIFHNEKGDYEEQYRNFFRNFVECRTTIDAPKTIIAESRRIIVNRNRTCPTGEYHSDTLECSGYTLVTRANVVEPNAVKAHSIFHTLKLPTVIRGILSQDMTLPLGTSSGSWYAT